MSPQIPRRNFGVHFIWQRCSFAIPKWRILALKFEKINKNEKKKKKLI